VAVSCKHSVLTSRKGGLPCRPNLRCCLLMSQKISLARMSGGTGTYLQQRHVLLRFITAAEAEVELLFCMQHVLSCPRCSQCR
jgi:hypothetical protein